MPKLKMPSIKDVSASLRRVKAYLDSEVTDIDVRLQVYDDGDWAVRSGDSSYDLDHRGFWGASSLDRGTNCRELARELIDEAANHAAECGAL